MNISVKADYALHAIFDLATQPSGLPVKIADIAQRQHIPQKFLELILASLKQGGFVESRRGAEGGYKLARPADQITIGEVLRFVEQSRATHGGSTDAFTELWGKVNGAIDGILDTTSFAEIARRWKDAQKRYVANWEI